LEAAQALADEANRLRDAADEEELDGEKKLAKKKAGIGAGARAKRKKAEKKTAEEIRADALRVLKAQHEAGTIDELKFVAGKLRIEEQYLQSVLENGGTISDAQAENIKDLQARLAELKEAAKKNRIKKSDLVGEFDIDIPDIFGLAFENIDEKAREIGLKFSEGLIGSIEEKLEESRSRLGDKLADIFGRVRESPLQTAGLIGIGLLLARLVTPTIIGGLTTIVGLIGRFAGVLLRLSPVGIAITLIILNWERILPVIRNAWEGVTSRFDDFVESLGGSERALSITNTLLTNLKNLLIDVGVFLGHFFSDLAAGEGIALSFNGLLLRLSSIDLSTIRESLSSIFGAIGGVSGEIFSDIATGLLSMVSPEVISSVESLRVSLGAFFTDEGRLGAELLRLFQALGPFFEQVVVPALRNVAIVIGVIAAVVGGVILAGLQAFGQSWLFIEGILAGVVRIITGVIEIFTGLANIIAGIVLFIVALFTGNFQPAIDRLSLGFGQLVQGILDVFAGILAAVINFGGAFFSILFNWLNNILSIFGLAETQWGARMQAGFVIMIGLVSTFVTDAISTLFGLIDQGKTILGLLIGIISESTSEWLAALPGIIQAGIDLISTTINTWLEALPGLIQLAWDAIPGIIEAALDAIPDIIQNLVDTVLQFFTDLSTELIGNSIILDMLNLILGAFNIFDTDLGELIGGIVNNIIDGFTGLGQKVLGAIGLGGEEGGGLSGFFSGLFGGGEEGEVPSLDLSAQVGGEEGGFNPLTLIKESMFLAIQELQFAWDTLITNITLSWNLLWQNALIFFSESFMLLLQQGLITFLVETWLVFTNGLTLGWTTTFGTMLTSFQSFLDEMIVNINEFFLPLLKSVLDKVGDIEEAFTDMGDEAEDAFEKGEDAAEDLVTALKKVERKLDSLIRKSGNLSGALSGIFSASGVRSAQGGDFRTTEGLYRLHDNEMVLPPRIAESMRELVLNMNRAGIGRQGINVGVASGVPLGGGTSSVTNNNSSAQVNINANYIETQSPIQIRDDVLLALQLLN
jgi:hypothetical protein